MNILIVTSEYLHFAKVGGLADAVTSQAEGLAERGHTVTVVLPKYKGINTDLFQRDPHPLHVELGNDTYGCAVLERELKGVQIRLIEHEDLFRRDGVYGPTPAEAFPDNLTRFALLSRGALEIAARAEQPVDILHVHDWPAGLGVIWLRTRYRDAAALSAVKTVLSIHNLGFQGQFSADEAGGVLGITSTEAEEVGITDAGGINILKGAILSSDRIVTVSPTYATEIQQPRYGFGLHAVLQLRARHLHGILNGIDTGIWNPDTDHYIPSRYDVENLRGKRLCKEALQDELDLAVDPDTPVIGTITRLTEQKGIDELFGVDYGVAHRLLEELPLQWIVLGTGERWCEEQIRELNRKYPNFVGLTMYSDTLAHRIEAGSDFFLMPSRYEPCGLNQMYSMRYGTIPIVTRTGGLVDTVDSTAGVHIESHTPHAIYDAVRRAVELFREDRAQFTTMQHTGMGIDFSVHQSVTHYEALYRDAQAH
ncbi:MAG: glycogen/starch synthase [Spirochaeta sp.]|nr:glycogen/starch synthase [Spirochaeta sp.]